MNDIRTICGGIPVDEVRSKSTVQDGIVIDRLSSHQTPEDRVGRIIGGMPAHDAVRFIRYEPGNGTRYNLYFFPLKCLNPEVQEGQFEVVWDSGDGGGRAARFIILPDRTPHPSYIAEKLHTTRADSISLAELFEHLALGRNKFYGINDWVEKEDK